MNIVSSSLPGPEPIRVLVARRSRRPRPIKTLRLLPSAPLPIPEKVPECGPESSVRY